MKNVLLAMLFLAFSFTGFSQYKKAGFFSRKGRTIGIGTTSFIMGGGKGAPLGFFYEGSRESTERRIFTYGTLGVIPGYKFSYQTNGVSYNDASNKTVTISGKTALHFLYAFNVGYFLLNNESGDRKLKPFVTAGFNFVLGGGVKQINYPDGYSIDRDVDNLTYSAGFRGGAGCIYALSGKFSLKLDGGYTYQLRMDPSVGSETSTNAYRLFSSHVSASLGIRYNIFSE
jgi:hypothetical protein